MGWNGLCVGLAKAAAKAGSADGREDDGCGDEAENEVEAEAEGPKNDGGDDDEEEKLAEADGRFVLPCHLRAQQSYAFSSKLAQVSWLIGFVEQQF